LSDALIVEKKENEMLIGQKPGAENLSDFRPINFITAIIKIIYYILLKQLLQTLTNTAF